MSVTREMVDGAGTSVEEPGVTIGATGQLPRWSVSRWGSVRQWGDESSAPLDWFVAADDRWHVPSEEPTVRQRRIAGMPVVETRLRIPDGDAVQRVWAVPERGGMVVVEIENESPLPFAVAVSGPRVLTERTPADVPIQGIDLPAGSIVLPVGHRSTIRVVLPAVGASTAAGSWPVVPPADAVVNGWTSLIERASRLSLPDDAMVEAVASARCDLLLEGPVDPGADPAGFLLDVAELVRCGDEAERWLLELVDPAAEVARMLANVGGRSSRSAEGSGSGPESPAGSDGRRELLDALVGARRVAAASGDARATGDFDRIIDELGTRAAEHRDRGFLRRRRREQTEASPAPAPVSFADVRRASSVGRFVRSVESLFADPYAIANPKAEASAARSADLLPAGLPQVWLGTNFEVHGIPTGPDSTVSFALRWHGERPAVLWEQSGTAIRLTSSRLGPDWSTTEPSGETLWDAPPAAAKPRTSLTLTAAAAMQDTGGEAERQATADITPDPSPSTVRPAPFDPETGSFS